MSFLSSYTDRYYRWNFWRYWVSKIFNRPDPGDTPFPTPAWFRQGRAFEGTLRIIPLSYLDPVPTPTDFTADELATVAQRQLDYIAGMAMRPGQTMVLPSGVSFQIPAIALSRNPVPPIDVRLPAAGSIVIARVFMTTVAAARALGLDEIAVKVFYS